MDRGAEEEGSVTGSKGLLTAATMIASLMAFVDIAIINVALTDIRASFGTPLDRISWVSTVYMMANIVAIPMSGWLQRRFGFRGYFTACVAAFTLASALCATSWSFSSLVAFRAFQGLAGGALIPTAQALLFSRYPQREHGVAAALIGVASICGPLFGPFFGGWLIEMSGWHWIFLVNVPLGLLTVLMAWKSILEKPLPATAEPIDLPGIALLATGLLSLEYALEEGYRSGWLEDPTISATVTVSAICLATFVVHELETPHPLLKIRLLANPSYSAATLINFFVGSCVFSCGFMLALYCGSVLGYPALETGRIFLHGNLPLLALMPLSARLAKRADGRYSIAAGVLIIALSMWMNGHFTGRMDEATLVFPIIVRDFGIAAVFVPLLTYALSDVAAEDRGHAAALFNLTRELGGSVGTAWMTTSLDRSTRAHGSALASAVNEFQVVAQTEIRTFDFYLRARGVASSLLGAAKLTGARVARESLVLAFDDCFLLLALTFIAVLLAVPFLSRPSSTDQALPAH
jgi:DHA2 family multidrug resistance protein